MHLTSNFFVLFSVQNPRRPMKYYFRLSNCQTKLNYNNFPLIFFLFLRVQFGRETKSRDVSRAHANILYGVFCNKSWAILSISYCCKALRLTCLWECWIRLWKGRKLTGCYCTYTAFIFSFFTLTCRSG